MLVGRMVLLLLYSLALLWLSRWTTGEPGAGGPAPGEPNPDGDVPAVEPDEPDTVGEAVEETVEALSDNAMTRAPVWIRWAMGIIAPLIGLIGLAVSLVALLAANTGLVLPVVGEVTGDWPLGVLLLSLALWAVWLLWQVPRWQAAAWRRSMELTEREIFDIENSSRSTLGQILSGVAVLAGLIFAWQQLGNTSQTLFVSQEGQITDRFTRAVGQLGDEDLTIRLGGIYALERIARDSERDHETVMEILAAFARQRSAAEAAAAPPEPGTGTPVSMAESGQPATELVLPSIRDIPLDIDAVLRVISRRDSTRDGPDCIDLSGMRLTGAILTGSNLDLTNLCLRNVDFRGAKLAGVNLSGADLSYANFSAANLDSASFVNAQLTGATFTGANLSQANFTGATLTAANLQGVLLQGTSFERAILNGTDLSNTLMVGTTFVGANLLDANLTGATMSGVDLRGTTNLTADQVAAARTDASSLFPPEIAATPDF